MNRPGFLSLRLFNSVILLYTAMYEIGEASLRRWDIYLQSAIRPPVEVSDVSTGHLPSFKRLLPSRPSFVIEPQDECRVFPACVCMNVQSTEIYSCSLHMAVLLLHVHSVRMIPTFDYVDVTRSVQLSTLRACRLGYCNIISR